MNERNTQTTDPAPWPKPRWEPIWLACRACRHEWDDWQPAMVPVETWVAHCGAYLCPKCGAGKGNILIRTTPLERWNVDDRTV